MDIIELKRFVNKAKFNEFDENLTLKEFEEKILSEMTCKITSCIVFLVKEYERRHDRDRDEFFNKMIRPIVSDLCRLVRQYDNDYYIWREVHIRYITNVIIEWWYGIYVYIKIRVGKYEYTYTPNILIRDYFIRFLKIVWKRMWKKNK